MLGQIVELTDRSIATRIVTELVRVRLFVLAARQ